MNTHNFIEKDAFARRLHEMYDQIEMRYRPDVRWWLAEGLNTDETLKKNIHELHEFGFGAAEFLAMPEPGADSAIYGWGSDEWTADTRLIIEEATRRGMGFSITSGTHWACANLPDTYTWAGEPFNPDNKAAAKELDYATIYLAPGEQFNGELPMCLLITAKNQGEHGNGAAIKKYEYQGVVAAKLVQKRDNAGAAYGYAEGDGTGVLDMDSLTDISHLVTEQYGTYHLDWTAPDDGEYALFVYWMHGTGQVAVPSVSTNYSVSYMDPYGIQAMIDYWEEHVLTDDLRRIIRENGRGEIYMDSLELTTCGAGSILWGYHMRETFAARKGYDVMKYLPLITRENPCTSCGLENIYDYTAFGEPDAMRKVRQDFYDVMSDMYLENVLGPLQKWLHSLGMSLRAEPSYGVHFEISRPGKYVDGVEVESFAQNGDVDLYRGLLGSANVYGRTYSSETGAYEIGYEPETGKVLTGYNFIFDMDFWSQLTQLQFAAGVSRTVFHGYSAIEGSEQDTQWPGHEGMYNHISERFSSRQPASVHYADWTKMLARNQKVLRQGVPARDLAILRTDYAFINYGFPKEHLQFTRSFPMYDKAYFFKDLSLQHAGYTYDYFSPQLLEDDDVINWNNRELCPDGPAYRAILLYQDSLELSSAKRLLEIAKSGLPIVFVNNTIETIAHKGVKETSYGIAASKSRFLNDDETALAQIVEQIKMLPNVAEVNAPGEAIEALRGMGVLPRAAFETPNNDILTISRRDEVNGIFYTYAYAFKSEVNRGGAPVTFTLCLEQEGIPYSLNSWSGKVKKLGQYVKKDGRTCVTITLVPGESTIIALDLKGEEELHVVNTDAHSAIIGDNGPELIAFASGEYTSVLSDDRVVQTSVNVPEEIDILRWDITVEDWNEGERITNIENKFGHETREVYYTTRKTDLYFQGSPLLPWKDLPAVAEHLEKLGYEGASMAHVSGLGRYESRFQLPTDWNTSNGALLKMDNAGGGTVSVKVNGKEASMPDTRTLTVDISDLVRPGENEIEIVVASTLTNRMIQRNYPGYRNYTPDVRDYGLTGHVRILPYTVKKVK